MLAEIRESVAELFASSADGVELSDLEEFGWPEFYTEDARAAVTVLFEELGRTAGKAAALEAVVAQEIGDVIPRGARIAVCCTRSKANHGLGMEASAGSVLTAWQTFDHLVVIDVSGEDPITVVAVDDSNVSPVEGIDPFCGAAKVSIPPDVIATTDRATSERVGAAIRRALSIQQVASGRQMLAIAVDHVAARVQFGRPIGANQSVQHRLADVHAALKAASSAIEVSWRSSDPLAVLVGAGLSSRAVDLAIRNSLQVCGGMGFTEEFALAPLVRRSLLLAEIFDDELRIARALGNEICQAGRLIRLAAFDL